VIDDEPADPKYSPRDRAVGYSIEQIAGVTDLNDLLSARLGVAQVSYANRGERLHNRVE
jgi:hypothetical protein